jgi:hypothetical protein
LWQGCKFDTPSEEMPVNFMDDFELKLESASDKIKALNSEVDSVGVKVLTQDLEYNITDVEMKLKTFTENAATLVDNIEEALARLTCIRLYDIYYKVAHDATCEASYSGLLWTFSSLLVMTFFGFMMLTFRAAVYPIAGEKEKMDDYSCKFRSQWSYPC